MKKEHKNIGLAVVFVLIVGCGFAIDNPITYIDGVNDCDVIKYNGEYYLSGNWLRGDMISSRDLENWGNRTHVFSWNNTWHTAVNPSDPDADIHGTHIRYVNGTFHLYAHLSTGANDGITHAVSSGIWGPYTEPVNSRFAQNIDADTFIDENGLMYFYRTRFYNGESIWCRAMTDPGTLSGSDIYLIYPSESWYGSNSINEGSKVFKYRDKYYMLYNAYATDNPNYSFGCVEASSPTGFSNSLKYSSPVLTRATPAGGEEINTIGQPWVVEGLNGFERWIGYFGVTASEGRTQRIDRMHFFNRKLFIDGPTNRYSTGYHSGPAEPQLRNLFTLPNGPMPGEDWAILWGSGNWSIAANEARQSTQNSFSFNTVNRDLATNYLIEANIKFTEARDAEDKCGVLAYYQDDNNWMIVGLDRSLYQGGAVDCWYYHKKENGVDTVASGGYAGSVDYSVYHKIRVEKNGSLFKIRIDDKIPPSHSGTVSTIFTGDGIPGLYADHAAAAFDGIIYTIGWDEYDSGIQGWSNSLGGVPAAGNWTVAASGITQSLTSGLNYIFKGDLMPQYEFSAQVTKSGSADGSMGIMPVAIDLNNYLGAEINLTTDKLFIYGLNNGVSIPSQEVAVANLTTYNLRAVKLSDRVILFVDGQEKMTVYQSFGSSQVGLVNQNMAVQYNGILVYQTEPENTVPWLDSDVGTVGFSGRADLKENSFHISGSGADIWHLNDGFRFTYRLWSGDGEIIAKVDSIDPTDWWAKAGVMFRQNLSDNSAMVYMAVNAAAGKGDYHQFIWRDAPGAGTGITVHNQVDLIPSTSWLKLARQGGTFSGWYSQDGTNWTFLGSTSSVNISSACYVGLAVTSHTNARLCGAVFDNVSTSHGTLGVPAPWQAVDIGDVGYDGGADYNQSAFIIEGSGAGIGGMSDQFHYVVQPLAGIGQITARLAALSGADPDAKAGIMFRNTLALGASNHFLYVNKNGDLQLSLRQSDDSPTGVYTVPGGPVTLPIWLRLKRADFLGCAFELYYSTNGSSWTQIIPPGSWNLNCLNFNAYAGLAVTANNNGSVAGAVFDDISIQQCIISSPQGDINFDCLVNLTDVRILADQWLSAGGLPNANIYADARVDLKDFALVAQNWLDCGWLPGSLCP